MTESLVPMSRNHYHDGAAWHQDTGTAIVMGKSDAHFMGSHICSTIHHRIIVSIRTTPRTWISRTSFYINLHRKFVVLYIFIWGVEWLFSRLGMTNSSFRTASMMRIPKGQQTCRTCCIQHQLRQMYPRQRLEVNSGDLSNSFQSCQAFRSFLRVSAFLPCTGTCDTRRWHLWPCSQRRTPSRPSRLC